MSTTATPAAAYATPISVLLDRAGHNQLAQRLAHFEAELAYHRERVAALDYENATLRRELAEARATAEATPDHRDPGLREDRRPRLAEMPDRPTTPPPGGKVFGRISPSQSG